MSDNDLIRRGDVLKIALGFATAESAEKAHHAIAALPAVTVGVKPLVWKPDAMKGSYPDRLRAVMPCGSGDYSVAGSKKQDKWQWFRNGYFVDGHQLHDPMPIEAAKAAAQSDYEARILAALKPVAAPRRYMGQIMAECDCSRQVECEAAQRCLAAPDRAHHVNKPPKSEHDAGNVLTPDPAAIRAPLLGTCSCGMTGPCMWDQCKHPLAKGAADDRT